MVHGEPKKKRRRNKGTGSLFQRKRDGRWVARIYTPTIDGGTSIREFVAATRDGALAKLQEARDQGKLRREPWSSRPLRDFAWEWYASRERSKNYKPTTLAWDKWDLENRIVPELGAIPLKDLRPRDVARFISDLLADGVGRAAVSRAKRCLSAMLTDAVAAEEIESNPALRLSRRQGAKYRAPEAKTLTFAQLEKLFQTLTGRYRVAVLISAMTGLREGEVIGLEWRDVNLNERKIEVNRNIVQIGKIFHDLDPKTESSRRVVRIPNALVTELRALQEQQRKKGAGVKQVRLFLTETGRPPQRSYLLRKVLRPALKRAGLPPISWRELRHSFASASIELGVPNEALSRTLGHKDPTVTNKIYNKAFRARESLVADVWEVAQKRSRVARKVSNTVSKKKSAPRKKTRKR